MFLLLPADNSHPEFWTPDQRRPGFHRATGAVRMERTRAERGVGTVSKGSNKKKPRKQPGKNQKQERNEKDEKKPTRPLSVRMHRVLPFTLAGRLAPVSSICSASIKEGEGKGR